MENDITSEIRRENLNSYCLKRGWVSQKDSTKGSPTELSKRLGRGSSFWSDVLRNPKKSFGASLARFIEEGLDLPRYSLDGDEESTDYLPIKTLNIDLSAGPGKQPPSIIEELGDIQFRRNFLSNIGVSIKNAAIVHVRGTSMEPTIHDGAVILLNRADTEPRQGFIYAFRYGDMLHVKRFIKEGKNWIARSDNPDKYAHTDILINGHESSVILGRAIWMGSKL